MVGSALSSKTTAQLSGGEKIKGKSPTVVYSTVSTGKLAGQHRRVLPVLRYPRNMVIYHYPLIGVIFMVILLIFIIQNYPNFFSKYYPKFTIQVIYPFIFNLGEF